MRQKRLIAALLMFIMVPFCGSGRERKFEAYTVLTPDSEPLVSMARSIAGPGDRVAFDKASSRILVYASPEVHSSIQAMLKDVNTLPRNISLTVIMHEAGSVSAENLSVGASAASESGIKIRASAASRKSSETSSTAQKIVLRSGGEAVISVGTEVPFLDYLLVMGRNWGYIKAETQIRKVGASLRVKAAIAGNTDLISVTLTPELTGLSGDRITRISYTRMTTTVPIRNGETITIGSYGNNNSFYERFLAGYSGRNSGRLINITMSAAISEPTGRIK